MEKCIFGTEELSFLGHKVSTLGVQPLPDRVDAIQTFPRPQTIKGLREFLGLFNWYRRFVPHAANILQPLHLLLEAPKSGKGLPHRLSQIVWTDKAITAFNDSKNALSAATLLVHPQQLAATALTVDASDIAVGAVLEQLIEGMWKPLAFF